MPALTTSRSTSSTGSPARAPPTSSADLSEALALEPEHLSCYELEAKPGTRFTHAHGDELARQAEAMEGYFERVVERLTGGRLPLVRDRELLPAPELADGRDLRSRHNLAYWRGRDYLGLGIGAVSTIDGRRWRNDAAARALPRRARGGDARRQRELEALAAEVRRAERVHARPAPRRAALARRARGRGRRAALATARAARPRPARRGGGGRTLALTARGRFLGGGVTAELLA